MNEEGESNMAVCFIALSQLARTQVAITNKGGTHMQKITPCLWFDNQVEEAVKFCVPIFKNSKIGSVTRYGEAGP
jgi:hypothetical protein